MKLNTKNGFLLLVVLAAAFSRLIPHAPNVTPIGALALFGAAYFSRKSLALVVPAISIFLSSLVINNVIYQPESFMWMDINFPAQILAFGLIGMMAFFSLKKINVKSVATSSISASLIFFVVTNFSTWLTDGMYPMTLSGLITCYEMAIPFFWNTLAGDLVYVSILFGGYELVRRQVPALAHA